MNKATSRFRVLRVADQQHRARPDFLATEEPLEIRTGGKPLTVTMRTPGHDFELATGFLISESVVARHDDIAAIRYCAGATMDGQNSYNVVDVTLAAGVAPPDPSVERNFYTTSSCGVCGKATLEAVRATSPWPLAQHTPVVDPGVLARFPDTLRAAQRVFQRTGGLHAAGLFDPAGRLLCLREDVGRHNAVDKVAGWALGERLLPAFGTALMVSGRASFELTQKAAMAGIPLLAAVSAPSSLAVELARELGMTLVGFLRGESMNVYAGGHRLGLPEPTGEPVPVVS